MSYLVQSNASEFECYLRDRAQRLGYRTTVLTLDDDTVLPQTGSLALVEFRETLPEALPLCHALDADSAMRALHDQAHCIAWAEQSGGLVQLNVVRNECGNDVTAEERDASRMGVRRFAEEFFGGGPPRTLPICDFQAYLAWLATVATGPAAPMLAVVARVPDAKELLIQWAPSLEAVLQSAQRAGASVLA